MSVHPTLSPVKSFAQRRVWSPLKDFTQHGVRSSLKYFTRHGVWLPLKDFTLHEVWSPLKNFTQHEVWLPLKDFTRHDLLPPLKDFTWHGIWSPSKTFVLRQVEKFNQTQARKKFSQTDAPRKLVLFFRKFAKNVSWKSPPVIAGLTALAVLGGGLTYYLSTTTAAVAVMVDGQQIGLVSTIQAGRGLVQTALTQQGRPFGLMAKTHDQITYTNVRVNRALYLKSGVSEKALESKLSFYLNGYALEANNSVVAVLPSKSDVEKVLREYRDHYVTPGQDNNVTSVAFGENLNIQEENVPPSQVETPAQVLKTLIDGKTTTTNYTVKPKDSWWLIARKNNMLTDEVLAGNPGETKDTKLHPGQVIKLVNVEPYLTVVSKGTYTGTETVPFDVVTKADYKLAPGQTSIVKQGSNGAVSITYSYVQKNGIDTSKKVLSEKVLKHSVSQVIAKGPSRSPISVAFAASRGGGGSSNIVDRALSYVGSPYVFGGTNRSGFDCSGFTKYVYAQFGISLPRTSFAQFDSGTPVSMDNLQPGDLVFFTTYARGASHVGIYIGGGRFVQAANPNSGVEVSNLGDRFYTSRYLGARRYN
ncbi:D-gamma-glutamyl-meso-diaminopimelic acid endopeptidase CwlS precursor [Peptococcaceae bacterium CEB3]|nr:D-gamma-glutamyl-meso-diaminopimelic acid endopeptidase CwlS precursor [Peptococcaceae bacterium CEB3]